jgi:hypothetical protein
MPLQAGDWTANVGGTQMQLKIIGVDPQGNVTALFGFAASEAPGFWDEDSQRLTLLSATQLFVGYLFTDPVNLTGVSGSVVFTLAGVVEDVIPPAGGIGPAPTAKRSAFGWYAQIGVD